MLVRLLKDLPEVLDANVLSLLSVKDHIALAGVDRAFRGVLKEVEAVRWLMGRGAQLDELRWTPPTVRRYSVCAMAAQEGHLEALRWVRDHGCGWNLTTCARAAANGHLEVLRWARANGCEWNAETCAGAAGGGHLEVLRWARENGCRWDWRTLANAAGGGHLEVVQWAMVNGCR